MQSLTYSRTQESSAGVARLRSMVRRVMSDTVRTMRSRGLSLLIACSAACHVDLSLDLSVHHPAVYAVVRTNVKVYAGEGVSCAAIRHGDLTEAELAALTVDEQNLPDDDGRLEDRGLEVSRLGGKSIVARGYDAQDRYVTAGCQDVGEIAGATRVQIDTEPTAVVAIEPGRLDLPFSDPDPARKRDIVVNMADVKGAALEGMVSWQLVGPAGTAEQQPSTGVLTSDGEATLRVEDLGTPGPQGLRIRVPWAIAPLPHVTGFDLSNATTIPLPGGALGGHPSCDLRGHLGGPPTLVCLAPADAQLHRDVVEISWQDGSYVSRVIPIPGTMNNQFALFVDHDGSADEPVYVISANATGVGSWYRLGTAGGTSKVFDGPLQGVVYVPRCRNATTALVGLQTGGPGTLASRQQLFTPAGAPLEIAAQDGEIVSGGCVADVDMREHQAIVFANAAGSGVLQLIASGRREALIPGTQLTGSGFVTVETQGMIEKRFVGTRLQATGTVVFQAVLAPTPKGSFRLVYRTEVEAAAPPGKILGGKLDSDDDTDLMWVLSTGLRLRALQVSLAKRMNGVPLTAITSGPSVATPINASVSSDFLAGDLDGQRVDEMVVFTSDAVTIYSPD